MSAGAKPLPHDEIMRLIELAQAGAVAADLGRDMPPGDERHECARAAADGIKARNAVVMANMRLVTKIAAPMAQAAGCMNDLDDLIQAGVMGPRGTSGLMRAIALFDTKRGKRFSTYATQWIRVAVRDAIDELRGASVRGGAKVRGDRVKEIAAKLATELERKPTRRELKARCVLLGVEAPSDRIIERLEAQPRIGELDPDALPAPGDVALDFERADAAAMAKRLMQHVLSPLEQRALTLHFGLDGGDPLTLLQLGAALEMGEDRFAVSRLINRATKRLAGAMLKADGGSCLDSSDSNSSAIPREG